MFRAFVATGVVCLAVLCAAGTAAADAEQTGHISEPWAAEIENPCNGELILFEGQLTQVVTSHLNPSGQLMIAESAQIRAEGLGSFGNSYRYVQTSPDHAIFEFTDDVHLMNATGVTSARIIGEGGAPDFAVLLLNHVTINANGEITSTHEVVSTDCH